MAAGGDDVNVKFGADIAELKEKFGQIGESFKLVAERFEAMAAVVAGGAAFKKFIDEAVQLNTEAFNLSRMLGMTGEQAGILGTALEDVGANTETYAGAFLHFNRALRMNSDEMKAMGVDVAGLASGQKTSNEVFVQALTIFGQYKPGIDQTQAAMRMFGRSVEDVYKIQRLANDVTFGTAERLGKTRDELNATLTPLQKYEANIETARKKNEELNLTISKEGVEATLRYKEAINDVEDVLKGMSKTIGEAVMPHFTELGQKFAEFGPKIVEATAAAIQIMITLWDTLAEVVTTMWGVVKDVFDEILQDLGFVFGKEGPDALEIFKDAVKVVQAIIVGFGIGFQEAVNVVRTGARMMSSAFETLGAVIEAVTTFGPGWWGRVKAAVKKGVDDQVAIVREGTERAIEIAIEGQRKLDAVKNGDLSIRRGTPAELPSHGTRTMPIGKDTTGQDATLAARLALQKAHQEAVLKLQLEFLKEAGDQYDAAYKHGLVSTQGYYDARLEIERRANQLQLDTLNTELAAAQDAEAKARAKGASALKPQDRNKAEAEIIKFQTEQEKLQGQINVLQAQQLDITRRNRQEMADALQKTDDDLTKVLVDRAKSRAQFEVDTEKTALDQMKALRQISAQDSFNVEQQLEDKRYNAMLANIAARRALIRGSEDEQRVQQAQLDAEAEAAEQDHQARVTQIHNAGVLDRMQFQIDAQQRIEDAMGAAITDFMNGTKSLAGALKSFFNSVIQEINNMVAKSLVKNFFGAGTSGGGLIGNFLGSITGNSGGGFFSLFSAAGGWDQVPADTLAQVHKDEMVLSPSLANAVRAMASMGVPGSIAGMARVASVPGTAPLALGAAQTTGPITINQNFPPASDPRTMTQVAAAAARGLSLAARRNG